MKELASAGFFMLRSRIYNKNNPTEMAYNIIKMFENFNENEPAYQPKNDYEEAAANTDAGVEDECDMGTYEDDQDELELDEKADPFEISGKDRMRLEDIIGKAEYFKQNGKVPGPEEINVALIEAGIDDFRKHDSKVVMKAKQLAQMMANKITDVHKALRRARAAEELKLGELATIFHKKQFDLLHK